MIYKYLGEQSQTTLSFKISIHEQTQVREIYLWDKDYKAI